MKKPALQSNLLSAAQSSLPDDGLAPVRAAGLAAFGKHGFPSVRDEDWRYTNLGDAAELGNAWLEQLAAKGKSAARDAYEKALPDLDVHALLLCNGMVDEVSLQRVREAAGTSLEISRLRDKAGSVRADGPLDALNAALLSDGVHIRIPAGAHVDKPLVIFLADGGAQASQARIVIEAGEGAAAELVEYHLAGEDAAHYANTVTQLSLSPGAEVRFVRVQERAGQHVQTGKLAASLQRDATLDYATYDLGGSLVRNDVVADITEPGATVCLHGLYLADGEQHIDNHTRVDHRVGPAASREEFRGILNGKSRCVFNGKAIVHVGADGTDAQQANHNLLLSERAEIDTKPELEIYAEDVKCSHGATVGQLDETALFYMRSRGLDRDQAAHVLTRAFAASILEKMPIEALREHLDARIDARLDQLLEDTA